MNYKIKPKMLSSLELGVSMTAFDWFYDFNVMVSEFSDGSRCRLFGNYYWYFN